MRKRIVSKDGLSSAGTNGSIARTSTIKRGFSPRNDNLVSQPIKLTLASDLKSMTLNWNKQEIAAGRRLVSFTFTYTSPSEIVIRFRAVPKEQYDPSQLIISCIYWEDLDECIATSVDIILLLEHIVRETFGVKEKNRIRRNLQSLKPHTISRSNRPIQNFFNLLMGMENPRPRNIEKDLKVFKWSDLYIALTKVISKYSSSVPSSSIVGSTKEASVPKSETKSQSPQANGKSSYAATASFEGMAQSIADNENSNPQANSNGVNSSFNFNLKKKRYDQLGSSADAYSDSSSLSDSAKQNGDSRSKSDESIATSNSNGASFVMTPFQNSSTGLTSNVESSDNSRSDSQDSDGVASSKSKKKKRKMRNKEKKNRALSSYIQDQSDRILGQQIESNDPNGSGVVDGSSGPYYQYPENSQLYMNKNNVARNGVSHRGAMLNGGETISQDLLLSGKIKLPPIMSNFSTGIPASMVRNLDSSVDEDQKRSLNKVFAQVPADEHVTSHA